ncbi:MAG: ABC transporter ATP-binding protein [Deltaproteobacteria bacterium]
MNVLRPIVELFGIAWREGSTRLSFAVPLMLAQWAALPLSARALQALTDSVVAGDMRGATTQAVLVAALVIASLTAGHFAHIFYFELGDLILLRLQRELIELSNGSAGLEHHERPDYADKLQVLREELSRTGSNVLGALLGSLGLGVALVITGLLLGLLNPWLLLLPLAAIPPLLLGRRAESVLAQAREAAAQPNRRARHLFILATDAGPAKELRVCGLENEIRTRHAAAWAEASRLLWRGELHALGARIAGQVVFAVAYVGAVLLVVRGALAGQRSVGDVILVITLAAQVNHQVNAAVNLHQELQRIAKTLADVGWIRDLVKRQRPIPTDIAPPTVVVTGITFDNVAFGYPGSERKVLEGVNLCLPAGSTVALVGENGAGKSTLVKLLCGFYEVSDGAIRLDGVDLRRFPLPAWRARIAAGFQDFVKFEFVAREVVGLGHLPEILSEGAVRAALRRASSEDLLDGLGDGLETVLGKSNPTGIELSLGQWQKLALGRAMMRESPLLLVLDEPTSALDAQTEHLLFEQYAANARRVGKRTGAITILVSHRFSTVRMADQILVMAGRRVSEAGTHDELMDRRGLYAELYALQARAYQ